MSSGREVQLEDTQHFPFSTRAFATGIPTALVSGAIEIYEDASITQITAAETLTVSLDGVAGFNMVAVAATAANGFEVGKTYTLILSAGTVDSVSVVGEVVGQFEIVTAAAGADKQADIATLITNLATVDTVVDGIQTDLDNGTDGLGAIKAETALIVADTNELQSDDVPGLIAALNDPAASAIADAVWDEAVAGHVAAGSFGATDAAILADTNELQADDVPTLIAAVQSDTDDLQTQIGTAGAGLTDLGGMSTGMKAEVESEANDALVAQKLDHLVAVADADDVVNDSIMAHLASATGDWSTFDDATDSLQALRDRGDAAWTTGAGGTPPTTLQNTTIATLASQTSFTLTAGSADDSAYVGAIAIITDQATSTQKAVGIISAYTGSTKTVTLKADPGIFTMATTDTIDIVAAPLSLPAALPDGAGGLPISDAGGQDIDAAIASIAAIEVDTSTTLQAELDAIQAAVITNAAGVDIAADIIAVKAQTAAIETDTQDIQTQVGTAGAGLTDLGGMSTAMKAEVNAEADTALTDIGLDHLVSAAVVGADVADNSIVAKLADDGATADWDGYDNTTASLEALNVDTDAVIADLANGTDGLGALKTLIDAIQTDLDNGTDGLGALKALIDTVDTVVDAIKVITDQFVFTVANQVNSNTLALSGSTDAADKLEASAEVIITGAAEAGTLSTTQMTSDLVEATDDHYIGRTVIWTSGVLIGQASDITDYTGATGQLDYTAVTEAPSAADTFVIV